MKKLLKEGNTLKCPACARSLWLQPHQELSKDTTEFDFNELSPVALQLHKHLLDHGNWWGQALITNGKVSIIKNHLFIKLYYIIMTKNILKYAILKSYAEIRMTVNITSYNIESTL